MDHHSPRVKVVSHEGPGLENVDWNFELASVQGFGETYAELLAEKMGARVICSS